MSPTGTCRRPIVCKPKILLYKTILQYGMTLFAYRLLSVFKQIIKKARKSIHAAGASTRAAPSPNIPIILQAAGHVKVRLPGPEARPPYSQRASQTSLENQKRT